MDNAQKAIMIGVALFLTILVIAVVLLITNTGLNTAKKSGDQIATISKNLEKQIISQYDQKTLTPQDVSDAIDRYNKALNYNIIVGVGRLSNNASLVPWKASLNVTPGIKYIAPENFNVETCTYVHGDFDTSIGVGWNFLSSSNLVASNNLLKEKINSNDMYKSILIKGWDASSSAMVTVIGLMFVPIG